MVNKVKVYYAGKIGKNDWRHELYDLRSSSSDVYNLLMNHAAQLISADMITVDHLFTHYDFIEYCGPFFIGCDHGCGHGENSHGQGVDQIGCLGDPGDGVVQTRQNAFNNCLGWIDESDVIFAYIDDVTAYGTLVELGYAAAKEKDIFIAYNLKNPSDFWFSSETAQEIVYVNNIHEAHNLFVEWLKINDYLNGEAEKILMEIADETISGIK